jgi:hypothetical protein
MDFLSLKRRLEQHSNKDLGLGATIEQLQAAELELRVVLRGSYRAFLEAFGWGGVDDIEIFGLGSDVPLHLDLIAITMSERNDAQPPLPLYLIPVANDGAGNLFCLDASEAFREEYPMVFWNHEAGPDQEPEPVARDFAAWLSELVASRE